MEILLREEFDEFGRLVLASLRATVLQKNANNIQTPLSEFHMRNISDVYDQSPD